jgi:hypothetical protein
MLILCFWNFEKVMKIELGYGCFSLISGTLFSENKCSIYKERLGFKGFVNW